MRGAHLYRRGRGKGGGRQQHVSAAGSATEEGELLWRRLDVATDAQCSAVQAATCEAAPAAACGSEAASAPRSERRVRASAWCSAACCRRRHPATSGCGRWLSVKALTCRKARRERGRERNRGHGKQTETRQQAQQLERHLGSWRGVNPCWLARATAA